MRNFGFIFMVLFLGHIFSGYGQETTLTVIDARSKDVVPFAHVVTQDQQQIEQKTFVTDLSGKVQLPVSKKIVFTVSALGFRLLTDTIEAGKPKKVFLEPSVYNMDEVVVTGQFTPQAADKSIFRVKVIGARQIDQKASNNLGDLMAGELNIRSSFDGALGSKITMQGLGGEHIKVLVDGVPIIGRMNGNIDLGQLNLYNAKQIEVIEGPMSVIYGSNALAGVINIITGENPYSQYTANASAYLETVGIYNFTADASIKKNRWVTSAAVARNFFDGFDVGGDNVRSQKWKPKRQYNADANVSYAGKDIKMRFSGAFFNEMLLNKGELLKPYYETALDSYFKTNRFTAKADGQARVFKDRYLSVLASYSFYNRIKNTYFKDLTTLQEVLTANTSDQDTTKFGQYLLRAEFSKSTQNSPFNYQLGIDLNQETGVSRRILNERQAIGDYAAFLSLKLRPSVRWMLQPGLRYGYNTKYKMPLVYSMNVKWDLNSDISARASYAKGFRAPSLKELYLEFVDVNHNIRGNELLKAEDSQNINLSFHFHKEKPTYDYGAEVNFFYNEIHNSITLLTLDSDDGLYTYINLDQFVTQGYMMMFNNRLYPWLELKLGAGQTGRKQMFQKEVDVSMIYSTDILGTVNYLWRATDLRLGLYYKYNGKYPEVFANSDGTVYRTIMSGYHTFDANLTKTFFNNSLNFQVGVKNLFDNTNVSVKGDSGGGGIHTGGGGGSSPVGWGRTFFVKVAYQFQKLNRP